ncbi:hypothetical protein SESBI_45216 [Sesbania bispinosa]|nr:hypothetical protein SESBI_45216 [Sesbania bispinosa]
MGRLKVAEQSGIHVVEEGDGSSQSRRMEEELHCRRWRMRKEIIRVHMSSGRVMGCTKT